MTLLFCNVGWMESYKGLGSKDKINSGGSYVKEKGTGHEVCNFVDVGGFVYGYVQAPGGHINIDRIGAGPDDDFISGITVVWTASRPTGGTSIVGFYENATVFRDYQEDGCISELHVENNINGYWIKARMADVSIVPVDERTYEIPRRVKGGMGQSNVWYADKIESAEFVQQVKDFINGVYDFSAKKIGNNGEQDQERKVQVEQSAIRACCRYFESHGYWVESVEKDNLGWDLVATLDKITLNIEVKGLSGDDFVVGLTPNEYDAFSALADNYRLAVVTEALTNPTLSICRYSKESGGWVVEGGNEKKINISIKKSAVVSLV